MEEKNKSDEEEKLLGDTTMNGEFISSYFAWIPISKQKERAEEMNKMTKNKEGK